MIPRAVETKVDIKYPLVQISDPPIGNVLAGTASSYLFFNLISAVFMPIWLWLRLLYFMVGYLISWIFIFIFTVAGAIFSLFGCKLTKAATPLTRLQAFSGSGLDRRLYSTILISGPSLCQIAIWPLTFLLNMVSERPYNLYLCPGPATLGLGTLHFILIVFL